MPQGSNIRDLIGQTFTRLTVIARAPKKPYIGNAVWRCRCTCGAMRDVVGIKLTTGATKSCGCLRTDRVRTQRRTHGRSASREYYAWNAAKQRCHNPKTLHYHQYGGRGIAMCPEWRQSFVAFFAAMGPAPTQRHSLDRLDNDRGYEPGNVRWADSFQQANNTRTNHRVTFADETWTIAQWERKLSMPPGRLKSRLLAGWSVERALTTPVR